jgi:hypothetical protein
MAINRISNRIIILGVFCVVFVWGCAQQDGLKPGKIAPKGGIKIALKPVIDQRTSYKVTTHASRNIKWQGPVPKKEAFDESSTEEQIEMGFTQHIQSVDAEGKAVARITIDSLKCLSVMKNKPTVDFDSSRQSDLDSPLAKLIGQSYTMEFEPDNYISSVLDLTQAQSLVSGRASADRVGQNILSSEAITERHAALLLPQRGKETLRPGDKWSIVKTFSFGMMGTKSYEKIYTLKEVQDASGHQIAVIDMNAIPTSEIEQGYKVPQAGTDFPKMFDTSEFYTGAGEVDLTAGCINSYRENLQASWVTAFPSDAKSDPNEPVVLRMTATRNYSLEKIK